MFWHWIVRRLMLAVLGATITTIGAFQIIGYLQLGYLDPFFEIAIVTSGAFALLVSVSVGILFQVNPFRRWLKGRA
jgi:hypothetical protein